MARALVVALLLATTGCAGVYVSAESLAQKNQRSLATLERGMSRPEVERTMDQRSRRIREAPDPARIRIANPYRVLELDEAQGRRVSVLYYYTTQSSADGYVSEEELTPVVLAEGRFVGTGEEVVARECDPDAFERAMGEAILAEIEADFDDRRPAGPDPLEQEFREAVGRASYLMRWGSIPNF